MENNKIAEFFDKQREIIEAAETPFAKLATFVLPIVAPLVPAFMTGLHLFKLFSSMFTFDTSHILSGTLSIIIAVVLELLGYVGAVTFIQALFLCVKEQESKYLIPVILTFLAYLFYLVIMLLVNVALGRYFEEPVIVSWIVGFLSFITVPTGLLSANNLSIKEDKQIMERRYQEARADKMEKYKIKRGIQTYQKVSEKLPILGVENGEFSKILPNDWRKVRPLLSWEEVLKIANWNRGQILKVVAEQGKEERTLTNWRTYAKREVEMRNNENQT